MKIYNYKGACNCSGARIRTARERLGISQELPAEKVQLAGLDVNQKTISRIETGARVVPDYELMYYAKALDVGVLWLIGQ